MKTLMACPVLVVLSIAGMPAQAQPAWRARAVRFVVPSAPGGGTDITARIVAPKLSKITYH